MVLDKYSAGTTLIKMSEVSCVRFCHQLYLFSVLMLFRLIQDLLFIYLFYIEYELCRYAH